MCAQNVELQNTTYYDVPAIELPKNGGGIATFTDTTISTNAASASDITSGKLAYVNGSLITGTLAPVWKFIKSGSFTINTTSTQATAQGTLACGSEIYTSDFVIWVHVRGRRGKANGYFYGSDTIFTNHFPKNNATSTFSYGATSYIRVTSSGTYGVGNGTAYGVYGYSITSDGTLTIRSRYNSSNSLTINDTFDVSVYKLSMPTGVTLFT